MCRSTLNTTSQQGLLSHYQRPVFEYYAHNTQKQMQAKRRERSTAPKGLSLQSSLVSRRKPQVYLANWSTRTHLHDDPSAVVAALFLCLLAKEQIAKARVDDRKRKNGMHVVSVHLVLEEVCLSDSFTL